MRALHSPRPSLIAPNILKARILGPKILGQENVCGLSRATPVIVDSLEKKGTTPGSHQAGSYPISTLPSPCLGLSSSLMAGYFHPRGPNAL